MQPDYIPILKAKIEARLGRNLCVPRDYDLLSESIQQATGEHVSATTLKRLLGYLKEGSQPRQSTLGIIARYVGYRSWQDFCEQNQLQADEDELEEEPNEITPPSPVNPDSRKLRLAIAAFALLLLAAVVVIIVQQRRMSRMTADNVALTARVARLSGNRVLIAGRDTFKTYHDFLRLFPTQADNDSALLSSVNVMQRIFGQQPEGKIWWYRPLRGLPKVCLWAPTFHHPVWHNEGDSTLLMPTITEYADRQRGRTEAEKAVLYRAVNTNEAHYRQELRVVFMSGLGTDSFIFLGAYVLDKGATDEGHSVWRRVSREVDLDDLPALERLRQSSYR